MGKSIVLIFLQNVSRDKEALEPPINKYPVYLIPIRYTVPRNPELEILQAFNNIYDIRAKKLPNTLL